jgi:hypothetical protein
MSSSRQDVTSLDDDTLFQNFMGSDSGFEKLNLAAFSSVGKTTPTTTMSAMEPKPYSSTGGSNSFRAFVADPHDFALDTATELFSKFKMENTKYAAPETSDRSREVMNKMAHISNLTTSFGEVPASSTFVPCPEHRERVSAMSFQKIFDP